MPPDSILCVNVSAHLAVVIFDSAPDVSASVYWQVNRKSLFVKTLDTLDGIAALDFGPDLGSVSLHSHAQTTVSLRILAFPSDCGPQRYVSNNVNQVVGLSTSFSRPNFVKNQEVMCFWMLSDSDYSYRISPIIAIHSFDLVACHGPKCHSVIGNEWHKAAPNSYFQLENTLDFYSSVYSVQFRGEIKESRYSISTVLGGHNFTTYPKTPGFSASVDEPVKVKNARNRTTLLLFILTAILAITGIFIVSLAFMCVEEPVVTVDEIRHLLPSHS
jgi:hypothetical protein